MEFVQQTQFLEIGDYFPFVTLKLSNNQTRDIHNYIDNNEFIIIHCKDVNMIGGINILPGFHYIIIYLTGEPITKIKNICTSEEKLYSMFREKNIGIYFLTPNRKIYKHYDVESIDEFNNTKIEKSLITSTHLPFLVIDNVLSPELMNRIEEYYNNNLNRLTTHAHAGKNRHHVHPDRELEKLIDNKLSRSVFPEIMKIYYFDVKYRESYKICRYNAETGGRFHPHRDTPHPYQHRRYAMSLFLNDDYEGGEFELPEYNFKVKPKANTALIFPGISTHKVNQVTKGTRKVIITFFCSEIEGKTKDNSTYTVKSDFFRENGVQYSNIFPI